MMLYFIHKILIKYISFILFSTKKNTFFIIIFRFGTNFMRKRLFLLFFFPFHFLSRVSSSWTTAYHLPPWWYIESLFCFCLFYYSVVSPPSSLSLSYNDGGFFFFFFEENIDWVILIITHCFWELLLVVLCNVI